MDLKQKWIKLREKVKNLYEYESSIAQKENKILSQRTPLDEAVDRILKERELKVSQSKNVINSKSIDLNDKVDKFIKWYQNNITMENGFCEDTKVMKDFIEKMAVWYELRYPEYEINKILPCCGRENKNINYIMFENNKYINELFDEKSDVRALEWSEFYNTNAFISSLTCYERELLSKRDFSYLAYLDSPKCNCHIHINSKGHVSEAEDVKYYTDFKIEDNDLIGLHIKEVLKIMKKNEIVLPKNNELEIAIKEYDNWCYQKEEMLNCVMYRIIERGGIRIGPRRAFLFAKEFNRDIDIPMMYGVDCSDPGLRRFINEYIKAGGSKNLVCYIGYFLDKEERNLETITIEELIKTKRSNALSKYTKEERDLQQKLVNILSSQVNQEEVRKEEVKQLRIQRKIYKSMKKKN